MSGQTIDPALAPVFVADRFSWLAMYLGPVWCVFHRAWFALLIWILAAGAWVATGYFSLLSGGALLAMAALLQLAFGFEANALYRRALERRSMPLVDHVVGSSLEQAEQKFFERWISNADAGAIGGPLRSSTWSQNAVRQQGISLFPEAGG